MNPHPTSSVARYELLHGIRGSIVLTNGVTSDDRRFNTDWLLSPKAKELFIDLRNRADKKTTVVVGGDFGGSACAKAFGNTEVAVTVIDRRSRILYQP